ncbi:Transcriptional regulator, AbiEi antitoxin, Type IV TA system [Microlunatus sagamiharensis]|uniref:Transcriptional regulator, AbiEi antitoxin, Type IV TA system n=1 Tax=Microlunatus sagamiharensis TaxID=546874 RepID=A0A1H2N8N5_9ACTN|nr:hypothetical protein [Microlunatus sagamiharensis]SDV01628.1 Transcriptional regulator, AbiEi antitoxin, Type IV TA system [Microlunatus sagamiharensis]
MTEVKTHAQLLRNGFAADEIRRLRRAGALVPVRRGAYVSSAVELDRTAAHRRLVEATTGQIGAGAVVSHVSAAVVHGLPVPYADLSRVHVTRDREGGGRARRWVQVHGTPLAPNEVTSRDGITLTTVPRTFVDVARAHPMTTNVTLGDAVLRTGVPLAALVGAVEHAAGRHGVAAARRALAFLDARSESPGESVSRVLLAQVGVPAPEPQLVLHDAAGAFVARVDLGWAALGVVGEFDGRVKYGRALGAKADLEEVLWSEKLREDAIRRLGWVVVRWTWMDLDHPERLAQRLRAAFAIGRPMA